MVERGYEEPFQPAITLSLADHIHLANSLPETKVLHQKCVDITLTLNHP